MFNSGKKIVGKNYKDEYKKKHQSKFLSSEPEVKKRYGVFKIKELFKYEDKQHFQNLYGFDKKQLEEFALPEEKKEKEKLAQLQIENQEKTLKAMEKQQKQKLEQERINEMDNMDEQMDYSSEGKIEEEEDVKTKALKEIFSNLLDPNKKKEENTEQEEELYEKKDSKTAARYKDIISGEQAVQFFAMYGNTTPIKFIFCKKKEQINKYINRPYELEKIEAKDAIGDYFIISPTGITHVYDPEMKSEKNAIKAKTIAEFYTLSDWMYQSTLFDILTRINYFKDYRSFKVMTIWINYHRFKKYFNTRTKLSQKLFLAKPAFVSTMIKCNGQISAVENIKMHEIYVAGRAWTGKDLLDFDEQQRKIIEIGKTDFKKIIQETFEILHSLYESVKKRLKRNKDIDEIENAKTLQELKNKSMFILKEENKLRKKLIMMADKDKQMFDPFVRTIDLMVLELIYQLNKRTLKDIHKELVKERNDSNYTGIFSLSLNFHEAIVELKPTGGVLTDKFNNLFKCIIECFIDVPRIVSFTKRDMDQIVNNETLNEMEKSITRVNDLQDDSIKINLRKILEKSIYYKRFTKKIYKKLDKDFTVSFDKMRDKFDNFKKIQIEKESFRVEKYLEGKPKGEIVKKKIEEFNAWLRIDVNDISNSNINGIINVDISSVRDDFRNFLSNSIKNMEQYLKEKYIILKDKINKDYVDGDKLLKKMQFTRIQMLSDQKDNVNNYLSTLEKMKKRCEKFDLLSRLLKNFKVEMNSNEEGDPNEIKKSYEKLNELYQKNIEYINTKKEEFNPNLVTDINNNKEIIKKYNEEINTGIYIDPATDKDRMRAELENMEKQIEFARKEAMKQQYYIKNLDIQIADNNIVGDLPKLEENFKLRKQLWNSLINYDKDYNDWMSMTLSEIGKINIEDKVNNYTLTGYNLNKSLTDKLEQPDRVCEYYNNKLTKMNEYSATITALSSPSMQERHWKEIFSIISVAWINMESLNNYTLRDFLETHRIYSHADKIDGISAAAIAQEKIQKDIDKITNDWSNCQFDVQSHGKGTRDKFIIKSIEEINQFLEEHTQLVQSAMNSRYVSDIRDKVQKWEDDLNLITRVIEEWLQCQRQWIYLENIFSTEDIKRQIPEANKKFTKVNKGFKDLMLKTSQNRLVLDRCKQDGLLDMLIRFNIELDSIQKSLEDYLQTKRAAFPRFYFLSNDELLKILSNTRQPRMVQDYLNKCFDGIKTIAFASETSNEIISMISPENEEVMLAKSCLAHETIEAWLLELEETMYLSVYEELKKCLEGYPEYGISRKDWIFFGYPCQAVITVDQIMWARFIEDKFLEIQKGQNKSGLKEFYTYMEKQIFELAELVQTKCPELKKSLVERLIIINVHAREVVKDLITQGVQDKTNFEWSKQLKFYYEQDVVRPEAVIRQTNSRFLYGYEYLGNPERMVITPLTDKCYITLTSALNLNYGGAPAGPAGTGKTETTKDLSKAMAVKVNVFNCSDQLDFQMMGRMFCGLAECGAWACFDEFNRIDVEVLSVIAQQIETIQTGIREKKWELDFDGKRIKLKPRFGVFITMNPGYAGRSELPDNLKSLFRPVAMMIPDYALVSEVTLFSKGFKEAKQLSIKMFQLFKLSSEQLSKQKHYDFGLRGIKSILSRAGYLKGKFSHESEDKVLIRAMEDSNLPKFLDYDIELFVDIISDLFPKIIVPKVENKILIDKIKEQLQKDNLQVVPRLIQKINQLLDTMMVRLGNMVVGLTGTGKSTTFQILSKTLTELGKIKGLEDPWYCQVILNILNPKSVTKNELYMSKDIVTQTWEDGIVAKIMRQAEDDEKEEKVARRKWLCFDGPVDALWIEDMNTVLDDSRKLCLPDGSNIRIPKMMNLIFETNDLRVASPATVSRCGMIYMEPHYVGFIPLIETWNLNYKAKLNKIFEEDGSKKNMGESVKDYIKQIDIYTEQLRQFLPDALKFIRKNCKEMIPTVDVNLVQTFLNLFSCFFNPDEIKLSNDKIKELIKLYFYFCLVWSLGANIEESSRKHFTSYMRTYAKSKSYLIDPKNDIYDIFVKEDDGIYSVWTDKLKEKGVFTYNSSTSFFNILVPTSDTIKYQYLMYYITKYNLNVLFMGETGVGKSVIIMDFLKNLTENNSSYLYKSSNFSAKTTSKNVFDTLKASINKNGNFQPSTGKKFLYFIDDINLPQLDEYGSQQPIEFLRQLIDLKSFYDEKKMPKKIKDVLFMAACAPPSGGRNPVTPRLFRQFHMIWMTELSEDSMKQIFRAIVNGWLEAGTNKSLKDDTDNLINAATFIYEKIRKEKLPTPSKSHYTFNLRDLSKVVQGMLQINYENITDRVMLINLWTHETSRQFRDRLLGDDIAWFDNVINSTFDSKFSLKEMQVNIDKLIFTDIIEKQQYKMVADSNLLNKRINEALERYNIATKFGQMNMVFFTDAINHFCRISRILCQPRGNALLVGMGGSGRQSLTKLVGYILNYQMNSLQMTKGYNTDLFWKDLAKILNRSGTSEQKQIFLFSDTQILFESFLEDINNILNNGEVPNLFKEDELVGIFNALKDAAKSNGYLENRDSVYQYFVSRVRENLRIVLAFSPVGDGFRNRCRQFPSIINCCTIDWFNPWPNEALISVAERYLKGNPNLSEDEELITKLCKIFVRIQAKATDLSDRFFKELRRAYYITPTSYLEFLKLFDEIHKEKINIIPTNIENYKMGIQKLEEANVIVANLKSDLILLKPQLVTKKDDIKILIENLEVQKKVVGEEKTKIQGEKDIAEVERDRIFKIKDECDTELKQVKPILDEAEKALNSLTEEDIFSLKKLNKPPVNLINLGKCVCFIYESKGLEWADCQKILTNPGDFIAQCKDTKLMIQKLNDPRRLKELGTHYSLIEPIDYSKVSKVSEGLKKWVGAMLIYVEKWRFVNPKMISLEKATNELKVLESNLAEKSQVLRTKELEVETLTNNYEEANKTLTELQTNMETIEIKLKRSGRLVDGLKDEGKRWKENINNLNGEAKNLLANVIMSVAVIAFSGPYTNEYRKEFFKDIRTFIIEEGVYLDDHTEFSLSNMFSDPLTIREWNYAGLPADELSIDNAIITIRSRRWPLLIDPQMQANKWIKNFFKKDLKSYKISDKNIYNRLKDCISSGYQFLIENVEQTIDSVFEPILQKQLFKQGSGFLINMGGEKPIQYNPTFRLFITTKLGNPHYLPELSIKVTLINFTVTLKGLEDQLLVEVVKHERIDLEQLKDQLIFQINEDKKTIKEIETDILIRVKDASNDILDSDILVNKLDQSKVKSKAINEKLEKSEKTAKDINKQRKAYRPIAVRGSVLYFVVASLNGIDSMYNYSLEYFLKLFNQRLQKSEKNDVVDKRVEILIDDITFSFYEKISRGLFEKDKIVYAFLLLMNILLNDDKISQKEWNFFLRGAVMAPDTSGFDLDWTDINNYKKMLTLKECHSLFYEVESSFRNPKDIPKWKEYLKADNPLTVELPENINRILSDFNKLILLKTLREEKLIFGVKSFILKNIDKRFLESPPFSVEAAFEDSVKTTPLIFILSPGANPVNFLKAFAKEKNVKINNLSLGQGQGDIAKNYILKSRQNGDWVCLENCHLSISWMPKLEEIQEDLVESELHPNYRLWLTSMPTKHFPDSILQSGIKITNEPPKGIKQNLKGIFLNIKEDSFEGSKKPFEFKKLLFSLAFFHAVILERRKFGPLGWNIPYEWMNSDFETSKLHLRMYVDESEEIPIRILHYLVGDINYGGRVTDDKDAKLISAILTKYFNELVFDDSYKFSDSGIYYAPKINHISDVYKYLDNLPLDDDPTVFGLHSNANITLQSKNVKEFLEPLIAIQPRSTSSSSSRKPDDIVIDICIEIERTLKSIPELDPSKANPTSISDDPTSQKKSSLGVFLLQEVEKFNTLLTVIKSSIKNLQLAVSGKIVMSAIMEKVYNSFMDNMVPKLFEDVSYLSLKPLSTWIIDLADRVNFIAKWLLESKPKSYWLSAMFFPQGFNTAVLQTYARKKLEPIDTLTFRTNVMKFSPDKIDEIPEEGLNIHGLYLQGASWNWKDGRLREPDPGELWHYMPVIWFEPIKLYELKKMGYCECPLYKTSKRAGELSTTGHSTNFVMYFYLKCEEEADHWIRRGSALLTQLDN